MIDLTHTVVIDPDDASGKNSSAFRPNFYSSHFPYAVIRMTYEEVITATGEWALWDAVYFQVMWGTLEVGD